MYTPEPKLSFDAMTIVGNLNKTNAQKLSEFMSIEPQIRLWDMLQTKFKAKALQEKVYIEYDKVKADSWDRRNMRVEFNPNKLTHDEMLWLKKNIVATLRTFSYKGSRALSGNLYPLSIQIPRRR